MLLEKRWPGNRTKSESSDSEAKTFTAKVTGRNVRRRKCPWAQSRKDERRECSVAEGEKTSEIANNNRRAFDFLCENFASFAVDV